MRIVPRRTAARSRARCPLTRRVPFADHDRRRGAARRPRVARGPRATSAGPRARAADRRVGGRDRRRRCAGAAAAPRARRPRPPSREPRGGGGVAAPPAPPPDIDLFAQDARAKVAALRETLDGLTNATDRLRETAQTVVEDHGRALVRLERATGAPVADRDPVAAAAPPPRRGRRPTAAGSPAASRAEPEPPPPRAARARARRGRRAPEPRSPKRAPAPAARRHPAGRPSCPRLPPLPVAPRSSPCARRDRGPRPRLLADLRRRRRRARKKRRRDPTGIAATDSAITAAGGGISAIPQLRTGADADVRRDVCRGRIAAGDRRRDAGRHGWSCPGIRQVAAPVLVASGFARKGTRGRTCVSVPSAPALDQLPPRPGADRAPRRGGAPRRRASAAFAAGHGVRQAQRPDAARRRRRPGRAVHRRRRRRTLRDGSYPLSTRLILYATAASADTPEVRQAAARLRSYFAGTPPLYAIVLRSDAGAAALGLSAWPR